MTRRTNSLGSNWHVLYRIANPRPSLEASASHVVLISGSQFNPAGYDPEVLIVGAGAVGIVLGVALAREGRRVLVIEAGPASPPIDYRKRNQGPNTGHFHQGMVDGRMKALGGTTRLWGGQLVPFGPSDFAQTYDGKPRWPIGHEELEPYFGRALDLLQVPASNRHPDALWQRVGGRPFELGADFEWTMNLWLPVADFTKLFAAEIAAPAGPTIVSELEATGLEFASDGRVQAVRVRRPDGAELRLTAPQVILANGTMEIARLLLRAAATAPDCPFAGNTNLGRGFIDHLHGIVGRVFPASLKRLRAGIENLHVGGRKFSVKLRASDRFLAREKLGNCAVTFNAVGSVRQALGDLRDLGLRLSGRGSERRAAWRVVADAARTLGILAPVLWSYFIRRRSHSPFGRGIFLGVEIEQIPCAESRLFLDPAKPPEQAAIGIHWAFDGRELDSAARFCTELAATFAAEGLGRIELDPRLVARDRAMFAEFHDAYHHMGGARMADRAEDGVVDRDLRVFGCPNLAVAGAAVFPSGSFANPTLTALALALRLGDRLNTACKAGSC